MNSITSKRWNELSLSEEASFISKKFHSKEFQDLYNTSITGFPGPSLLILLRSLKLATLEILHNLDSGTVFRIRQTGTVYAITEDLNETSYPSYDEYSKNPMKGKLLHSWPIDDLVYTISVNTYDPTIERHKPPRFKANIQLENTHTLDGVPGIHIDITNVEWLDHDPPKTHKEISTVLKKTILFVKSNYAKAQPVKIDRRYKYRPADFYNLESDQLHLHSHTDNSNTPNPYLFKFRSTNNPTMSEEEKNLFKHFTLDNLNFLAEDCVNGILINPSLPKNFDSTPNEQRSLRQKCKWWERPFIRVEQGEHIKDHWPEGKRFDVRCLDGGAWDRSSNLGSFKSLNEAVDMAVAVQKTYHESITLKSPKNFEPTEDELKKAALTVAQHLSPQYGLSDPKTGKLLAKGQNTK